MKTARIDYWDDVHDAALDYIESNRLYGKGWNRDLLDELADYYQVEPEDIMDGVDEMDDWYKHPYIS